MVKDPNLPYKLPIAEEIIVGFIPFAIVWKLWEMQIDAYTIRTRFTESISYVGNH